ncbi:MAG: tRNA(Met) cytidine acetyltransferase, partial [Nitrococcus mobilis]|nr:tRNA(Met) cytidine acetyltransferase [Nitrococcus mobilis]
ERLDRDVLVDDEPTLSELFGLLVLAHYRTTPGDLRQLLDAPGLSVWVLRHRRHVAAAALVIDEGGFPATLARAIWLGLRRPQGHLVAQSLAAHAGLAQAPTLHGRRVLRIAVHPACRRRGLGTRLLGGIFGDARNHGIDYLATAFGATNELLRFWARFGMRVVRLGNHREASSGNCSAIVLRALSQAGEQLVNTATARFADRLPVLLNEPLHDLDPALALTLVQQLERPGAPTPEDWDDLLAFGFGRRQYMDTLVALQRLTRYALTDPRLTAVLSRSEQLVLLARTLQRREWSKLAGYLAVPGRRQVVAALRASVRRLALVSSEPQVRRQARELLQAR